MGSPLCYGKILGSSEGRLPAVLLETQGLPLETLQALGGQRTVTELDPDASTRWVAPATWADCGSETQGLPLETLHALGSQRSVTQLHPDAPTR